MSKLEEYKALQLRYSAIDNEAKTIVKPLATERDRKVKIIEDWFEEEYLKIEATVDKLYEEQGEIEDKLDILEATMPACEICGEYLDKHHKEALEQGFEVGECCVEQIDRCDNCSSYITIQNYLFLFYI